MAVSSDDASDDGSSYRIREAIETDVPVIFKFITVRVTYYIVRI